MLGFEVSFSLILQLGCLLSRRLDLIEFFKFDAVNALLRFFEYSSRLRINSNHVL